MKAAFMLLVLALPVSAKQVTMRIPLESGPEPEEIVIVTFDDNRILPADIKRWMLVHENGYYSTPAIGSHQNCKAEAIPQIQQETEKTRRMVSELDPNQFPPELSNVVMYLKDLQSLWLWVEEQELEFVQSSKPPDLDYKGIDLASCQQHFRDARNGQACQVFSDWHSCTNELVQAKLGRYPAQNWEAFLAAYGIQEKVESTIDD